MSLTKIEIEDFTLKDNIIHFTLNGNFITAKLDRVTMGCIKDNIESCIKERTYIEL